MNTTRRIFILVMTSMLALLVDGVAQAQTDNASCNTNIAGIGGSYNASSGVGALANTTYGNNVANGYNALNANTTGSFNTANSAFALQANNGANNTANGYFTLYANSSGYSNTATGYQALRYNTTGSNNTANGTYALVANTSGNYKTARLDQIEQARDTR